MAYSNINQYVFPNLYPKLSLETYDMSLTSDELDFNQEVVFSPYLIAQTYGNKLPIYFDINFSGSVQQQTISYGQYNPSNIFVSLNYYNPKNEDLSCFSSSTLCDIGLTGIDNGLVSGMTGQSITFTKGLLNDTQKFNRLSFDRRMKMFQVTGYTSQNVPFSGFDKTVLYEVETKYTPYGGYYHELYGGFYQGFYKLFGYDYEIFPERVNKGWSVEMILKPRLVDEHTPTSGQTTLNEIYPQNKNTFFYLGARAENKFYHHADGHPRCFTGYTRVTSGLTSIETCSCCDYNITNSRCLYVYPPRSLNNVHDPHVNYGCPNCSGVTQNQPITCGCDCSNYTCETCGWECFKHTCGSIVEVTPTPTPTPSSTPTYCEPLKPICSSTCSTCDDCSTCYTCNSSEFTSIENTCETDPLFDLMSNNISFKLSGDPKNPKICIKVLKFTENCSITGTCPTTGYTYTTGYTVNEYCTTKSIYDFCANENPFYLEQEHWFQINVVWQRYTWLDECDLYSKGGLGDITKTPYLESLANNAALLITVPYTQVNGKEKERIELVSLNQNWLDNKKYRKGKLKVYINGLLFQTFEDVEEVIPRGLQTDKEKQIGVPFNISWGGGTQGLRENLTFSSSTSLNGPYIQDPECLTNSDLSGTTLSGLSTNILIEENFAGTFDGGISQFRMYTEPLSAPEIKHNFNILKNYFNMFNPDCPNCFSLPCDNNDFTYEIETIPTIVLIDISLYISPGSVELLYIINTSAKLNFDYQVTFDNSLTFKDGTIQNQSLEIDIPSLSLSGSTSLILEDRSFNEVTSGITFSNINVNVTGVTFDFSANTNVYFTIPVNDFVYLTIPNSDLNYILIPNNDLNSKFIPNSDLNYSIIPNSDLTYITLPNSDLVYLTIPNSDVDYIFLPNNDLMSEFLYPSPTPTPTLTTTQTPTPTPTVTPTESLPVRILYYNMSDTNSYSGTSTLFDLESHSNASLLNSPISADTGCGTSIVFNGTNQYAVTSTDLSDYFSGVSPNKSTVTSIFMWIYPTGNGVILTELGTSVINSGWHDSQIEMVGGTLKFGLYSSGGIASVTSSISTPLNNWYYIGMVYDGTTMTAYVNATSAGQTSFVRLAPYNNGSGLFYGIAPSDVTNMGNGGYGNVRVGTLEIFNTTLSINQITQKYNQSATNFICLTPTPSITPTYTPTPTPTPSN